MVSADQRSGDVGFLISINYRDGRAGVDDRLGELINTNRDVQERLNPDLREARIFLDLHSTALTKLAYFFGAVRDLC